MVIQFVRHTRLLGSLLRKCNHAAMLGFGVDGPDSLAVLLCLLSVWHTDKLRTALASLGNGSTYALGWKHYDLQSVWHDLARGSADFCCSHRLFLLDSRKNASMDETDHQRNAWLVGDDPIGYSVSSC